MSGILTRLFPVSERNYIKQYLTANQRLIVVVMIFLSLIASGALLPASLVSYAFAIFRYDSTNMFEVIGSQRNLVLLCVCMLSYFLPIFQFRFLMSIPGRDLYFSLPIRRERLFHIHYISGVLFLVFASIWCSGINFLFHPGYLKEASLSCFSFFLFLLLGICLYTFFTVLVVKSRSMLDAFVICMSYTLVCMMLIYAFQSFYQQVVDQVLIASGFDTIPLIFQQFISLFSPPWMMYQWNLLLDPSVNSQVSLGWMIAHTILWMVFAYYCYLYAKKSFVRKKVEQQKSEQHEWVTYPFLLPATELVWILGWGRGQLISFPLILVFVFSMIAHFFVQRRIYLHWWMPVRFLGFTLGAYVLMQVSVATGFFGLVQEVPHQEDIERVHVQISDVECDYCNVQEVLPTKDVEQISKIVEGHDMIVDSLHKPFSGEARYIMEIHYEFHYGGRSIRMYTLPPMEEAPDIQAVMDAWREQELLRDDKEVY